jgi:hypothetical protein
MQKNKKKFATFFMTHQHYPYPNLMDNHNVLIYVISDGLVTEINRKSIVRPSNKTPTFFDALQLVFLVL